MNDNEHGWVAFLAALAAVLIAATMTIGINYYHGVAVQARLDEVKVRAGKPTSDIEARMIRLEQTMRWFARQFPED